MKAQRRNFTIRGVTRLLAVGAILLLGGIVSTPRAAAETHEMGSYELRRATDGKLVAFVSVRDCQSVVSQSESARDSLATPASSIRARRFRSPARHWHTEVFLTAEDATVYLDLMRYQLADAEVSMLAFCLVTNHVH